MKKQIIFILIITIILLFINCTNFKRSDSNNNLSPQNSKVESIGWGGGGWMTRIIYHPANSSILYSANDMGGVFKSTDSGETWTYISQTFHGQNVYDLAIDPVDYTLYAQSGNSVEKSIDDGVTWQVLTAQTQNDITAGKPIITSWKNDIRKRHTLVINHTANTIYVAGEVGDDVSSDYNRCNIYKSTNGGSTWSILQTSPSLFPGPIRTIILDPNNSSKLYACGAPGFYKSTDGGATWTQSNSGLNDEPVLNNTGISKDLYDMCIDLTDTNIFYVRTRTHGIYKSIDNGTTWSASNGVSPNDINLNPYSGTYNSHDHTNLNCALIMDPANHNRLLASFPGMNVGGSRANLYETTDAGASWHPFLDKASAQSTGASYDSGYQYQNTTIAPYAFGKWLGGSSTDIAINWQDSTITFGADDWGLKKFIGNAPVSWKVIYKGLITTCGGVSYGKIASLNNGQKIYTAGCDTALMKTSDWGQTWTSMQATVITSNGSNWEHGTAIAAVNTNPPTIYFGCNYTSGSGGLFKSTDEGVSWTKLAGGLPSSGACRQVLIDKSDATNNTLYTLFDGSGIYKTTNGGLVWTNITTSSLPSNPNFFAEDLAIDPDDGQVLYLAANSAVYKSTNGGTSWTATGALPTVPLSIGTIYGGVNIGGASGNRVIFVSGHRGIARSIDGGATWSISFAVYPNARSLNDQFSWKMPCSKVIVDPTNPNRVFFSTCSWGVSFRIPEAGIYTSVDCGVNWSKLFDIPNMGGSINITNDGKSILEYSNGMDVWRFNL